MKIDDKNTKPLRETEERKKNQTRRSQTSSHKSIYILMELDMCNFLYIDHKQKHRKKPSSRSHKIAQQTITINHIVDKLVPIKVFRLSFWLLNSFNIHEPSARAFTL